MKWFVLLLATVALSLPAGCGGSRRATGDGTVRDEEELTPAVDLAVLEHADVDAPGDETSAAAFSQRLAAIAAAAADRAALLDDPVLLRASQLGSARAVAGFRSGGDVAGSGSAADRVWEVKFPRGNTIQVYARILDYFGIELGVVQPDGTIVYAARLSKAKPDVHRGLASQERRYYLSWSRGNLADADQQLLARAGVDSRDKVVLEFLRPEMESFLAEMEKGYAGGQANRIEKTGFGIRRTANGYDIFVLEQTYK